MTVYAPTGAPPRQTVVVRQVWWIGYLLTVGGGLMIAAVARQRVTAPYLGLSLALILLLITGWLIQPRVTLYATVFLTAVSDVKTVWWFPFLKNLSSRESISFVADALTFSPLDLALGIGFVVSTVRHYAHTGKIIPRTPLSLPLIVFTMFVAFGFVNGVIRYGGDRRIAVLEGRPLFYTLLIFVIVVNECTEQRHLHRALWALLAGVVVQSLLSIQFLERLAPMERDTLESLNEHGSTLGHNLIIVTLVALVVLGIKAPLVKWALLVGAVPTVYIYFVAQRRAGVAALLGAGVVVAIALLWRRPKTFWIVTPLAALVVAAYVAAFWNSHSMIGFPAQAVKTIIAPGSVSDRDRSSDLYRMVETYDLNYTIRQQPLQGVGFGRPFLRPVSLADISFFDLNAYIPHNNVLWIWIKLGFGGFVAMFYVFAKAILLGVERIRHTADGLDLAVALVAVAYLVMYPMYSYVDISWDARNTVFLGLALAICCAGWPVASPAEPGSP